MAASEPQNAAERALVTQHPDAWAKLTLEQRARVLAELPAVADR